MDVTAIEALKTEAVTAEAVTAEPAPGATAETLPPAVDPVQEAKAIFATVVALGAPLLPYLTDIYTDDRLDMLAGAYVPVAQKYGWDVGGWLGNYSAEIALAAVAAPLAMATAKAHREFAASKLPQAPAVAEAQQPGKLTAEPAPAAAAAPVVDTGGMLAAA